LDLDFRLFLIFFVFLPTPSFRRIRSLEAHVADIRHSQAAIRDGVIEIVSHIRGGSFPTRSPSSFPPSFSRQSPNNMQTLSPSMSTPSANPGAPHLNDLHKAPSSGPVPNTYAANGPMPTIMNPPQRQTRSTLTTTPYRNPTLITSSQGSANSNDFHSSPISPSYPSYPTATQPFSSNTSQGPVLPPFSSIETMAAPGSQHANSSGGRYLDNGQVQQRHMQRSAPPGSKRHAPGSSNVTSPDSSDGEDDENGELPPSGLLAPWEVLRSLADVAIERAAKADIYLFCVITF
jgi:hypothetical protein